MLLDESWRLRLRPPERLLRRRRFGLGDDWLSMDGGRGWLRADEDIGPWGGGRGHRDRRRRIAPRLGWRGGPHSGQLPEKHLCGMGSRDLRRNKPDAAAEDPLHGMIEPSVEGSRLLRPSRADGPRYCLRNWFRAKGKGGHGTD